VKSMAKIIGDWVLVKGNKEKIQRDSGILLSNKTVLTYREIY
jgi:hypothetical protein